MHPQLVNTYICPVVTGDRLAEQTSVVWTQSLASPATGSPCWLRMPVPFEAFWPTNTMKTRLVVARVLQEFAVGAGLQSAANHFRARA